MFSRNTMIFALLLSCLTANLVLAQVQADPNKKIPKLVQLSSDRAIDNESSDKLTDEIGLPAYIVKGITEKDFSAFPLTEKDYMTVEVSGKKFPIRYWAEYDYSSTLAGIISCNISVIHENKYPSPSKEVLCELITKKITARINTLLEAKQSTSKKLVSELEAELAEVRNRMATIQNYVINMEQKLNIVSPRTVEELSSKLWLQGIELSNQITGNKTMMKSLEKEIENLRKKDGELNFGGVDEGIKKLEAERAETGGSYQEALNKVKNPDHPSVESIRLKLNALDEELKLLRSKWKEKAALMTDANTYLALSTRLRDARIETETLESKLKHVNEALEKVKSSNTSSVDLESRRNDIKHNLNAIDRIQEQLLELRLKKLQNEPFELVPLK